MKPATRKREALTARAERRLLRAIAARLPAGVRSDHLTILGVLGALGTGAGYALSLLDPLWLWLASAMLAVNWFGDSLDGTLARVRHAQRPRYGYYLDHTIDAFTTAIIGLGIGLSPFVSLPIGLAVVVLYLMLSINVYLESSVYGVFKMDYGIVGPTEARLVLITGNTLLVWATTTLGLRPAQIRPTGSLVAAGLALLMAVLLVIRFGRNLRRLDREDPLPAEDDDPRRGPPMPEPAAVESREPVGPLEEV